MARYSHQDRDDDAYASVGTPFEALETAEDVQKAKIRKDKEQYVLDEQGRRRFHGAFTGGFSAGYYNTVGSKEGWTPSTFLSSRGTKTEFSGQKPEDFMDAEDLGAHGIAPREVSTRTNFSQRETGGIKRQPPESHPNIIPGEAPLQNFIIPARSSVGARLLHTMGWREGQGVGPRVQKPSITGEKVYGCSLPQSSESPPGPPGSDTPLPDEVRKFAFAPQDVQVYHFEGKDDHHGIGYRGMEDRTVLSGKETRKALHGMSGEAFGIGALEDEDTEDHVYGVESMTSYDVTLLKDGDMETEQKFGWTGGVEDCWNLGSFTKATRPPIKPKVYHAPDVPRDFIPIHRFSILNINKTSDTTDHKSYTRPVTVSERNQLLADTPGSVFSLMSAADRERLRRVAAAATSSANTSHNEPPSVLTQTISKPHPQAPPTVLKNPPSIGDTSVDSIKPFAHNPLKQARYEAFNSGRTLHSDPESIGMTEWERQRERDQFTRTRHIYQPLAVSLSTRFTREAKDEEVLEMTKPPEPDSVQAAKANMFGVLTRQVLEWHPHRVLCKRFNVPDPYPNDGLVGTVTEKHKQASTTAKHIQFQNKESIRLVTTSESGSHSTQELVQNREQPEAAVTMTTVADAAVTTTTVTKEQTTPSSKEIYETASEEIEEVIRPPPDLFKTIFAESSSESEAEEETQPPQESGNTKQEAAGSSSRLVNEEVTNQLPRKSKWQDLSQVTTQPLTTTNLPSSNLAATDSNIAAVDKETVVNGDKILHDTNRATSSEKNKKKDKVFGPALPPGFSDVLEEGEDEREREHDSSHLKHKHHHHHHHHKEARNEKRKKHRPNDEDSNTKRRKDKKHKHKY